MKIALVHDYLNQHGGAEKVLEALVEMFPSAPIYTLLYDAKRTLGRFEGRIHATSILDLPLVRAHHRPFIPLMPFAARQLNLKNDYDVIISSSAGFGKGISYRDTFHISYCHTPLRYAWEPRTYFSDHLPPAMRLAALPALGYLRHWDRRAGQRPDILIANSRFIAEKIRIYYARQSRVIYPPVDCDLFYPNPTAPRKAYFLAVGRLMHYKRFDLIVRTFNELRLPLRIVGIGPEFNRLRLLNTSPNTTFLGFAKNEDALRELYNDAHALIFPQVEDFGLVAAEAIACGTPVIAYSEGGAREIINERNGIFFHAQTPTALKEAIRTFMKTHLHASIVRSTAVRFSKEMFKNGIAEVIEKNIHHIKK